MPNQPLLIVGLDGATFDILDPLMALGQLPHLKQIVEKGSRATLLSTTPPATLPAWTSFLTGAPPDVHGVIDMFMRYENGYGLVPCTGRRRHVPTFLWHASQSGRRVCSIGVPGTFPPEEINGYCISGFDAPGVSHAGPANVFPANFFSRVQQLGGYRYSTFNELRSAAGDYSSRVQALLADIEAKERLTLELYRERIWDVFFVHCQASDTAAHHLWHTYDSLSPRFLGNDLSDALPSIYRRLDAFIGRLIDAMPKNGRLLIVSDHGMGGASDRIIYLNRWLHEQGLLRFHTGPRQYLHALAAQLGKQLSSRLTPKVLGALLRLLPNKTFGDALQLLRLSSIDLARTQAFSYELDYAPAIWVHDEGEFPKGTVSKAATAKIKDHIKKELPNLLDPESGAPLIAKITDRESLGSGPFITHMPHLIIEPAWPNGYRPSFAPSSARGPTVRLLDAKDYAAPKGHGMPGVHKRAGIFVLYGEAIPADQLEPLDIHQAGALVYPLLDVPLPGDHPVELPPQLKRLLNACTTMRNAQASQAPTPLSTTEALEVTQRLQNLGYID